MFDQRVKGQWLFLSMKISALRTDLSSSLGRLNRLKKYTIYLLEISNQKIRRILEHVIGGYTRFFSLLYLIFPQKLPDFSANRKVHFSARLYRIQFRCRKCHDQACPCASSGKLHASPCDCSVTETDIPTIRYQFKRRLFSRRQCTGSYPWAGPLSRLQRLDLNIQFVLHGF